MKKYKREYTKEILYDYYIIQNQTRGQIAERFHTTESIVDHDLKNWGIRKPKELCLISQGQKIDIPYDELYKLYILENKSLPFLAKHFNVHNKTIRRRIKEYGIIKSQELQVQAAQNTQKEKYGDLFTKSQFYRDNVLNSMLKHMEDTCMQKYGYKYAASHPEVKAHVRQGFLDKYGVPAYTQTEEYHHKSKRIFRYEGEQFDSSWELALWIYAKDHGESIIRCPCKFLYIYDGKEHYYFPDFLYKDELVEIKGDHLLDENKELVEIYTGNKTTQNVAKMECIKQNNVKIWAAKEIAPFLNYIYKKYGRTYLNNFKIINE